MKRTIEQVQQALTQRVRTWTGGTIAAAEAQTLVNTELQREKSKLELIPVELFATILAILLDESKYGSPLSVWAALSRTSKQVAFLMENEDVWRALASVLLSVLPERYTGNAEYDRVTKQSIKRYYDAMFEYWFHYLRRISAQKENNEPWRVWKRLIEQDVRLTRVIERDEEIQGVPAPNSTPMTKRWIRYEKERKSADNVKLVICPECPYPFLWMNKRVYVLNGFAEESTPLLTDSRAFVQSDRIRGSNGESCMCVVARPSTLDTSAHLDILITTNKGHDRGDGTEEEEEDDYSPFWATIANHRVGILRIRGTDLADPVSIDMAFIEGVLELPETMHIVTMAASRDYLWLIAKTTPGITGSLNERYGQGLDNYILWSAVYDPVKRAYGSLHNHNLYDIPSTGRGSLKLSPWDPILVDPHHEGAVAIALGKVERLELHEPGDEPFHIETLKARIVTRTSTTTPLAVDLGVPAASMRYLRRIVAMASGAGWIVHIWRLAPDPARYHNHLIFVYRFQDAPVAAADAGIQPRIVIKYRCNVGVTFRCYMDNANWLVVLEERDHPERALFHPWLEKTVAVFINLLDLAEGHVYDRTFEAPCVFTIDDHLGAEDSAIHLRNFDNICATTYHNGTFTTAFKQGISILSVRHEEWYRRSPALGSSHVLSSHSLRLDDQREPAPAIKALSRKW